MTTIVPGDLVPASKINQWAPPGMVTPYAGTAAPAGWLLCDGASYLRTDYPELFAAIGTTYGAADGTHFNVPDLRGRVVAGFAAAGGHADASTLGANDGVAAANRRPKHRHNPHSHSTTAVAATPLLNWVTGGGAANRYPDAPSAIASSSVDGGSGNANDSLDAPAYLVLHYLIRAKDA